MKFTSRALWYIGLGLALAMLLTAAAFGQVEAGSISGTVRDASGAVIPAASVTVKSIATGLERKTESGNLGQFTIPGLNPGMYDIQIKSGSFAPFQTRAEVTVGGHITLDATLSVKETTTVEVVAERGTEVNTVTQELSQLIDTTQVQQLPSLTRNPYDFVALSGNVSSGDRTAAGGDQSTTGRGVGYAMNGQRTSGTEVLLDGVENVDLFSDTWGQSIPVDSVQEFRVVTSNFDAQYGRASGGVVNLTTKSGTNNWHGSAWEFNRLSAYTANTYANDAANADAGSIVAPKGKYTRNQFGYTFGGPIHKDKLFFFNSTEWTRVRSNANNPALIPTPEFLAYTAPNVQSFFQTYGTGAPAYSRTINKGPDLQSEGGNFTNIPDGTPIFGIVNYSAPSDAGGGVPQNTYRILGRVDYNMSDKTQAFFRYGLESVYDFTGADYASPYSLFDVGDKQKNNAFLASLSHTYNVNLFSNTKLSFNRLNIAQFNDPKALTIPELFLTNGAAVNGIAVQFPGLWAQYAGSGGEPYGGPQNVLQLTHDFAWTRGSHGMRFGVQYTYQQINRAYGAYAQGIEQLGTSVAQGLDNMVDGNLALFQAAINPNGKFPCVRDQATGSLIETPDCMLTLPATSPSFSRSYRYHDWAFYGQDSWRITSKFTFNYGVRYEHYGVQHNLDPNLDSNFYYGTGSNVFEQVRNGSVMLAGKSPVGGMWHPKWGAIAPRVGFAWDIFGDGKTSVRGGMGLSYERNFGNVTFNVIQNPPNYASVQLTPAILGETIPVTTDNFGPFAGASGTVPLRPSSLRHVNQNIQVAQTQFYSLSLEREVARNTILSLEYAGAHGVHLYDIVAYNALGDGQVRLGDPFDGTHYYRPNAQYTGINTRGSGGTSRYNGMTVRFQTNNLHNTGLGMVANYTWSHSLDDLSSTFSDSTGGGSNGIGNLGYLDPTNPKLDWGSSDFDIRHRIVITPIWETPWYRTGKDFKRQLLGGWTIAPVITARKGVPFSIFDTTNSLNAGSGYGIPRYAPASAITSHKTGSATAVGPNNFTLLSLPAGVPFADPVLGISDFGPYPSNMTGRNVFVGPGAWNADMAISKTFPVTERTKLEFRAESFNMFNHHNMYVNALGLDVVNYGTDPITIPGLKGGLGTNNVSGVNHDERRFFQFAVRVMF